MAAKGTVTENPDGTVRFTTTCMLCDQPVAVDRLDPEKVARWQAGEFVQDVFPDMSASERETLISGSHAKCFDEAFGGDEEDDEIVYTDDAGNPIEGVGRPSYDEGPDAYRPDFGVAPRGWPADGSDFGRYDFPNLGSPGPDRDNIREW
jgi:hypothetical protein